jgi:hypothetical protein
MEQTDERAADRIQSELIAAFLQARFSCHLLKRTPQKGIERSKLTDPSMRNHCRTLFLILCTYFGASNARAQGPDSVVVAWGDNGAGQTTVPTVAQTGVRAIAAGLRHTVALKTDGAVVAWGYNGWGQTDVPVAAQSGVTGIAAGGDYTLALKTNGAVLAWGNGEYGKTNVPFAAQSGVTAISAGWSHAVALKTNGAVVAWHGSERVLSWSTNAVGFTLQSTLQLSPPVTWTDVTDAPVLLGAQWMVTNISSGNALFYRLQKP